MANGLTHSAGVSGRSSGKADTHALWTRRNGRLLHTTD